GVDESVIEVERTHTQHAMTVPWTCYARWHEAPAGDRRGPRSRPTAATRGCLRLRARGGRSAVPRRREGDGGPLLPGGAAGARAIRDPVSDRRAASARAAAAGPGPVAAQRLRVRARGARPGANRLEGHGRGPGGEVLAGRGAVPPQALQRGERGLRRDRAHRCGRA